MDSLCRLSFFRVLTVTGEDAAAFLHGQLSNHILDLQTNEACFATYNTPKGRVIANLLVWRREQDFLLLLADDLAEAVAKRLRLFVLRSKVVLTDSTWRVYGFYDSTATAPAADTLKLVFTGEESTPRLLMAGGNGLLLSREELANAGQTEQTEAWFAREIHAGRPWIAAATTETCVAQMLNQHRLGGVHFKKGCYPGQEIIARAQYRGQVKRGLIATRSNLPLPPGSKIEAADEEVGVIINQAAEAEGFVQLAVIKFSAQQETLSAAGIPLAVERIWFETAV